MTETYTAEAVNARTIEIGHGYRWAGLVLKAGETAWNPASTKGPLVGPSLVEYEIGRSGIRVSEFDLDDRCKGGDRVDGWPHWKQCVHPRVGTTTRCLEHTPKAVAAAE